MSKRSHRKQERMRIQLDKEVVPETLEATETSNLDIPSSELSAEQVNEVEERMEIPEEQLPLVTEPSATQDTHEINLETVDTAYTVEVEKPSKKVAVVAIVLGILLIAGGWAAYRFFNTGFQKQGQLTESAQTENQDQLAQVQKPSTGPEYSGIQVPGQKVQSGVLQANTPLPQVKKESVEPTSAPLPMVKGETVLVSGQTTTVDSAWTANDYKKGDITGGTYTVKSGDTLWEISEAVYGSGSQWQTLATANHVGTLANGHPLILPGQVLTIP